MSKSSRARHPRNPLPAWKQDIKNRLDENEFLYGFDSEEVERRLKEGRLELTIEIEDWLMNWHIWQLVSH